MNSGTLDFFLFRDAKHESKKGRTESNTSPTSQRLTGAVKASLHFFLNSSDKAAHFHLQFGGLLKPAVLQDVESGL